MTLRKFCLALSCVVWLHAAWAQNYPSKTVRIIEPAGPGSAVDVFARKLTQIGRASCRERVCQYV